MDIVIISEFCEDFSKTDNDRFFYLAKMLSPKHQVEVVTSSFRHTTKSHRNTPSESDGVKIIYVEEPGYPKNVCIRRFYSHFIWGRNLVDYMNKRPSKPDVVYCAVPSLTGPNLVAKYCERENIRFVIDVQDLWPEAFQMVVNVPVLSSVVFAPFKKLANGIYKRADGICGVSDTYCQRAESVNKKVWQTLTVFLGTNLDSFDTYASQEPMLKKSENEIWIGYCGTLGSSYDLTCVIDAIAILNDEKLRFIVMGDGPQKTDFEKYACEKGIKADFVGRLEYNKMCSLLKSCDIVVNPIMHLAAQSIINKHADYVASGLPVVSTQESEEYRNLVDRYQMGFNCNNNDAKDLANKLRVLIDDVPLRTKMGQNARRCAEECFNRKNTYLKLVSIIENGELNENV